MPTDRWRVSGVSPDADADVQADGGTTIQIVCDRCTICRPLEEDEDPDEVVNTHAELGCPAAYYEEVPADA